MAVLTSDTVDKTLPNTPAAGKFKAGPGADTAMYVQFGAVFNGARGNDRITGNLAGATFYGGPGTDSAVGCLDSGNKMYDVEHKTKEECF